MTSGRGQPVLMSDPFYRRLKALVIERTGMAFYEQRDDDLTRVLSMRFEALGVRDCASYLELVAERAELEELMAELTIGETYFFRYREQFEALRDVILPEVIERNRHRRSIRIWSAGCATGPEPYTVAIILRQRFGHLVEGWDVSITGTDINQRFLARAREGLYEEWAFRATPDAMRNACFDREGKRWRIRPEYKRWVSFRFHNLVDDPYPSLAHNLHSFDVILCRNVVIYFTTETFRQVLAGFRESLVPEGWLVVGHSEPNTELFRAFRSVEAPGAVLYQKSERPDVHRVVPVLAPPPPAPPPLPPPEPVTPPQPPLDLFGTQPPPAAAAETPAGPADPADALRRLADQGAWVEVAREARRMMAADPLEPFAHLFLAMAQEHSAEREQAVETVRRAIYLDRSLALAHYHLGRMLRDAGDSAGADKSFRNALRLVERADPDENVRGTEDMTMADLAGLLRFQIEAAKA